MPVKIAGEYSRPHLKPVSTPERLEQPQLGSLMNASAQTFLSVSTVAMFPAEPPAQDSTYRGARVDAMMLRFGSGGVKPGRNSIECSPQLIWYSPLQYRGGTINVALCD